MACRGGVGGWVGRGVAHTQGRAVKLQWVGSGRARGCSREQGGSDYERPAPARLTRARRRHRPLERRLAPLHGVGVQAVQLVVAVRHRPAAEDEQVTVPEDGGGVRGARARRRACAVGRGEGHGWY